MPRYIDADTLYQKIDAWREKIAMETPWDEDVACLGDVLDMIEDAPTVDVIERKKGRWIGKPIAGYTTVRCSVCKNVFSENRGRWSFCPECGADMRGGGNVE